MNYKKVLVTGSSGFIGSHVVDALIKNGLQVVLFDNKNSPYKSDEQIEFIGSILNKEDLDKSIRDCDAVYHFAAQADIGVSSTSPEKTLETNIIGTQNVLKAAIKHKVKRFMFASTIYVYSELGSFYRVSKQACEKMIEEYQREFSIDYTILRFGSLYGPRANKFNGIQNFLIDALKNKKILRRGDGEEIREYIHVKDAAQLSVDALDKKYMNEHLIITGNQQIKVKDLLFMIKEIFKGQVKIDFGQEEELHHYEITPYNYKPQVAKKLTSSTYYDLGQGLMDLIYDLENDNDNENNIPKISLRNRKK